MPSRAHRTPPGVSDPVDCLPGMGPASRLTLAERGIGTVGDLVWTLPVAWDDLRTPCTIGEAVARATAARTAGVPGDRVCIRAVVKSAALVPMRGRRTVRVTFEEAAIAGGRPKTQPVATVLYCTWFFAAHGVLAAATAGKACLVLGRVRLDDKGRAHMAHPDVIAALPGVGGVRPRYPRLGVAEAALRQAIGAALDGPAGLAEVPDPVPDAIARREAFPDAATLLRAVHGRAGVLDEPPSDAVRRALFERLAWAEAFVRVRERLEVEARRGRARAPALPLDPAVHARLLAELGFALTAGQSKAILTIAKDLAREAPTRRLVLGDVGTGKTAVALAAAAQCVAAGWQVAILAPTTVLAEQYMDAVAPLARATAAPIALVTGGGPAAARRRSLEQIGAGKISIVVGTHALLGEGVAFARLGLVVVDEQQRLGVAQRLALVRKGAGDSAGASTASSSRDLWPHLLTLSATPIPRTLALALRGELATSVLDERPAGRLPTATEMRPSAELASVVEEVRAVCARGERVFWVCPRIEEDLVEGEDTGGAAGRARELLVQLAPTQVTLIHGAMRPEAKRRAMRAMRAGDAQVLVGTTVVEVGVDVPEATLMVVEGAERFGLSQLHQLRGRVGRGDRPGRCIVVHGPLTPLGKQRLDALCSLSSGTDVARADLTLRGAGDLGGTRQSGDEAGLLYLDPAAPPPWLTRIEADARAILDADPSLELDAHRGLAGFVRRLAASRGPRSATRVRDEAG
jgi:ATP-dependent DNA helicase RecG